MTTNSTDLRSESCLDRAIQLGYPVNAKPESGPSALIVGGDHDEQQHRHLAGDSSSPWPGSALACARESTRNTGRISVGYRQDIGNESVGFRQGIGRIRITEGSHQWESPNA
jgi:hypothetical protein